MNQKLLCAAVIALSAIAWAARPRPTDAGPVSVTGAADEYDIHGRASAGDGGGSSSWGASTGSSGSSLDLTGSGGTENMGTGTAGGGTSATDTIGIDESRRGTSAVPKDGGTGKPPSRGNTSGSGRSVDDLDTPTLTPDRSRSPMIPPTVNPPPPGARR